MTKKLEKTGHLFTCDVCTFVTSDKQDYTRHNLTAKHIRMTNELHKKLENTFDCECGKVYKYRQGLFAHKKVCRYIVPVQPSEIIENVTGNEVQNSVIIDIIRENQEIKQMLMDQSKQVMNQSKQVIDLHKENNILIHKLVEKESSNTTINNTTNNNTMNNQFNINLFLNEKCKDALNISDFMDTLQLNFENLEYVGNNGYVNGITKIIMDGLDKLDIYQRPIHCTDKKRETLYIKDNDVWNKDTENKDKIRKFVGGVAKKNLNMVSPWQHSYPGIEVLDSPAYNLYMKIMRESINCGGRQEHADRNDARIIKNLINRVYVDKHIDTKPSLL